jgi:hypothetical protein
MNDKVCLAVGRLVHEPLQGLKIGQPEYRGVSVAVGWISQYGPTTAKETVAACPVLRNASIAAAKSSSEVPSLKLKRNMWAIKRAS